MKFRECTYIGLGHMGMPVFEATHRYFIANGWKVRAVDLDTQKTTSIATGKVETAQAPQEHSTVTIVGVRPQDFLSLSEHKHKADIVISMMAGISVETIQSVFPGAKVIRIIPNTPCAFGAGITPIYIDDLSPKDPRLTSVLAALSLLGPLLPVSDERMIDCATGISAGGPAYIMLIADAMISTAEEMGFEPAESRQLVAHTLLGSAKMLMKTGKSPKLLAQEVMTPNGTTERGVAELRDRDVGNALRIALHRASERATELAHQAGRQ